MPMDHDPVPRTHVGMPPVPQSHFDWYENQVRSPREIVLTDAALMAAYFFSGALAWLSCSARGVFALCF
jgi:hypothetical protein